MTTDEVLYRSFLDGNEDSLRELMERYGNPLTLYINSYIHDVHDAEDLMIEAFSYLITKKPPIRDNGFKPYLYKAARSLSLRFAARRRLRQCFGFEETVNEPESETLIEEVVQAKEWNRTLYLCMNQLHPDYREALYLVYFEGMHHAEAAMVMHKSEKQVADLVYRGKRALRKLLEQEGFVHV